MDAIPAPAYIDTAKTGKMGEKNCRGPLTPFTVCAVPPKMAASIAGLALMGVCKTGSRAIVSAAHAHFGEEAPLVGTHGSGTIFFSPAAT